jgi:Zn-dependent metalloprotease
MMRILSFGRWICLSATIAIAFTVQAQKPNTDQVRNRVLSDPRVKTVNISNERLTPSFIVLDQRQGLGNAEARNALLTYLGARAGVDDLVSKRQWALQNKMEVQEFQQYFKGLKVEHSRYTALMKSGKVRFFNGAYYDIPPSLSTHPKLSEVDALRYAKKVVGAKVYAWEQVEQAIKDAKDPAMRASLQNELNSYLPKGELVVVRDFSKNNTAEMHLAYKFNIYSFEPISRQWVYVDANDGSILLVDKIIKHIDNPGKENPGTGSVATMVQTRYAGMRSIYTKQISGNDPNSGNTLTASNPTESYTPGAPTYVLMDDTRGNGIETYDLNGVGGLPLSIAATYSQGKAFTDVDNNWTLAEHKRAGTSAYTVESESDDIAWDAQWGATVVYDYWKAKHSRLSFDGNNGKIKNFIHSGIGYDNAFWNGEVMTYGDGTYPLKSNGFKPLTSLDVCGHEIGHGVCEFTSNLVYAKESGAMNEGLSDIWASCIEYFAMTTDPSLQGIYNPFYVGEQISPNPASPLRRMDSPQAQGDPDTYGGANWSSQDCSPTLANDQCGVHTNSGVLNKWFYLITVGSGAGSGPDAKYAGVDDGVNDKGNAYSITGLGFNISEQIVFMMESMMTSTADYAEARNLSIQAAVELSGNPCSEMVKSVTNAWYAVGVGDAFVEPCKIYYGFIYQPGSSVSESKAGDGCTSEYEVKIPVLLPANSNATLTTSGTATNGVDYRLGTTSLSNTTTAFKSDFISLFIKNDGVVEGDEYLDLAISVTNTGTNAVNNKYRLNITEDDVTLVIDTETKPVFSANFTGVADGFNPPTGWSKIEGKETGGALGANYNRWGVWSGKLMVTGKTDDLLATQMPSGTYNSNSPTTTIIYSPLIDARGINTLNVSFKYRVQGEVDVTSGEIENMPVFDYMSVVYSLDGVNFYELGTQDGFVQFAAATPTEGTFTGILPAFLNNKTFYLGFRWFNDTNAGGPESVQVDDITIVGSSRKIENELADNSNERLLANQKVHFYSLQDGEVLGTINNTSAKNYGCTGLSIAKAGSATWQLDLGSSGKATVADKVLRISTEETNRTTVALTVYYTEDQIQALEAATGVARTSFSIFQVNAFDYTLASNTNTTKLIATYSALPGVGGSFTASVPSKLGGSYYLLGYTASKTGGKNQAAEFTEMAIPSTKFSISAVYPNPVAGNGFVNITAPSAMKLRMEYLSITGQLINVQDQQVSAGENKVQVSVQPLTKGMYMIRFRDDKGTVLDTKQFVRQ